MQTIRYTSKHSPSFYLAFARVKDTPGAGSCSRTRRVEFSKRRRKIFSGPGDGGEFHFRGFRVETRKNAVTHETYLFGSYRAISVALKKHCEATFPQLFWNNGRVTFMWKLAKIILHAGRRNMCKKLRALIYGSILKCSSS